MSRINWDKIKKAQKPLILESCIHELTRNTHSAMIQRCTNPDATGYKNYGGRGIRVCERWLKSYKAFVKDMGLRPGIHLTLERIAAWRSF